MKPKDKNSEHFMTFAQGIFIVKSKNSNFNSDFTHLPRRLPDKFGTIYATDKALKYCIRRYLHDNGEKVFVWRRTDKEGSPLDISKNFRAVFGNEPGKKKADIISKLLGATDVRFFGATYAGKKKEETNVSITGSIQLTYGINKFKENVFFSNDILSPYRDVTDETAEARTIGNETKTLEAHYVYDFVINPNNLITDLEFLGKNEKNSLLLSTEDVNQFKEAICKGVNYVNSSSKIGNESELLLFVEMKSETDDNEKIKSHILPLMKDLITIERNDEGKTKIVLSGIFKELKKYDKFLSHVEIYYDDTATDLVGIEDISDVKVQKNNIVTLLEIGSEKNAQTD